MIDLPKEELEKKIEFLKIEIGKVAVKELRIHDSKASLYTALVGYEQMLRHLHEGSIKAEVSKMTEPAPSSKKDYSLLEERHPHYDGVGCDNHIVCSEYETSEELARLEITRSRS